MVWVMVIWSAETSSHASSQAEVRVTETWSRTSPSCAGEDSVSVSGGRGFETSSWRGAGSETSVWRRRKGAESWTCVWKGAYGSVAWRAGSGTASWGYGTCDARRKRKGAESGTSSSAGGTWTSSWGERASSGVGVATGGSSPSVPSETRNSRGIWNVTAPPSDTGP